MGEVKSTTDNLRTAVSRETFEFKTMYLGYSARAREDRKCPSA